MSIEDPVLRVATVPAGTLTAPDGSRVYAVSGYTAPPPDGRPLKKAYAALSGLGDGQRVIYVSNYPNGTLVTPDGRPVYALTAAAFGGGGDVTAPTITSSSTPTVAEGQPFNHTLTANEAVTWSKIGGADQLLFSVGGNTLSMTAKDFEAPTDANGDNAYVVTVRATDGGGNTTDQTITVTVTDAAEADVTAPTINSANPSGSYAEGVAIGGTLTANEVVTWSKIGTDAGVVTLNPATGVWSLPTTDYETKTSYVFSFVATDGAGNTSTQNVAITITDIAEGGGSGTLDPALSAPQLTADPATPADGSSPDFFIDTTDGSLNVALGYKIVMQWLDKAGNVLGSGESAQLTAEPSGSSLTISNLSSLPAGTRRYRARFERTNGSAFSAWSAVAIVGPDDIAPILSAFTQVPAATSATIGATTDEANGTRYYVVTASSTAPSKAQVKAGQNNTGAAALKAGSAAVGAAGAFTSSVTGLTAETGYHAHQMHEDALGNQSDVLSGSFTTLAAAVSVAKLERGTGNTDADGGGPLQAASVNRSQYVDSPDGYNFVMNNNLGEMQLVRSLDAPPDKFHFEVTISGFEANGCVYVAILNAATAVGPQVFGQLTPGGAGKANGFSLFINSLVSNAFEVRANGDTAPNLPSSGAPAVGETFSFDCDRTANTILVKRKTGGSVVTLGTVTLTSQIPTNWTVAVGGKNLGDGGFVNFGQAAWAVTPVSGHMGW